MGLEIFWEFRNFPKYQGNYGNANEIRWNGNSHDLANSGLKSGSPENFDHIEPDKIQSAIPKFAS